MDNKHVGWIIIGMAALMIIIVFLYSAALKDIVSSSCTAVGHGDSCPMYETITKQNYLAFTIIGILVIFGVILITTKPNEKIVVKKIKERIVAERKPVDYTRLNNEEKHLVKLLEEADGGIFQSDLVDKSGYGKVRVTRILDKLEGRQVIERKRRGMSNFVVLKNS